MFSFSFVLIYDQIIPERLSNRSPKMAAKKTEIRIFPWFFGGGVACVGGSSKEMWRTYSSDTRVGEQKLGGPIRHCIRAVICIVLVLNNSPSVET